MWIVFLDCSLFIMLVEYLERRGEIRCGFLRTIISVDGDL